MFASRLKIVDLSQSVEVGQRYRCFEANLNRGSFAEIDGYLEIDWPKFHKVVGE